MDYINYIEQHPLEITALVVAIFSALFSLRSTIISNKAFKLALNEFNNKKSNFKLYHIDSLRAIIKNAQGKKKLLLFQITLTNLSSTKNSFKACVEIEYRRNDNSSDKVTLNHNPELTSIIPGNKFNILPQDIKVNENDTSTGWLIFEQPSLINDEFIIEKYILSLNDSHSIKQSTEILLLRDTIYDNENQSNR